MIALAAAFALLLAGPAQDSEHDRLVAEFVASLPPAGESEPKPELGEHEAERVTALSEKYPAQRDAIRAILVERTRCSETKGDETTAASMVRTARALSDEELRSLIAFYTGPDYALMEGLKEDDPAFKALTDKYPLMRFYEAMQGEMSTMFDEVFANEQACDQIADAALGKIGITE